MEAAVERSNMWLAYQRVVENKGAPGVDGLTVAELKDWLKGHWPRVNAALLAGTYLPRPVRRVDLPKPQGGVRTLGVPTVVDRLIQQALHQVMQPIFEPDVLGFELWVSSRTQCGAGRASGPRPYSRGAALGGGYRSGEVL